MSGVTLDTGFLIALEKPQTQWNRVADLRAWSRREILVTVPAVVIAEWWRGEGPASLLLNHVAIEPLSRQIAELDGEALAEVDGRHMTIDAIVMASASQRGDVVYTADPNDLLRFCAAFPGVRVERI